MIFDPKTPEYVDEENFVDSEMLKNKHFVDNLLINVYENMLKEDPAVHDEALSAYQEYKDEPNVKRPLQVNRRAPYNPLAAKASTTFVIQEDPALMNNPLRGRLVWTYCSTAVIFMVFCQALCVNKTVNKRFVEPSSSNSMFGPDSMVLYNLGGLNVNAIRNEGETFRLFWAMWMHAGWIHIILNLICQVQYLIMFEPDWGFFRVSMIFFISGISGNLLSAVANPCSTTVGSSGALFGLMGAMITYCMEYWTTIPRPGWMLGFTIAVLIISLLTGFTAHTDNWAHFGGLIGGLCLSLATVKSVELRLLWADGPALPTPAPPKSFFRIRGTLPVKLNENHPPTSRVKTRSGIIGRFIDYFKRNYRCGKTETVTRVFAFTSLLALWITCFLLIYSAYEYQPLGQITYGGVRACCCCYHPEGLNRWHCAECESPFDSKTSKDLKSSMPQSSSQNWGQYCNLDLARMRTMGLKPEFQGSSLFDAMGFQSVTPDSLTPHYELRKLEEVNEFQERANNSPPNWYIGSNLGVGRHGSMILDSILDNIQNSKKRKSDFTEYFEHRLSREEESWLREQEQRFNQVTNFLTDIVKHFYKHAVAQDLHHTSMPGNYYIMQSEISKSDNMTANDGDAASALKLVNMLGSELYNIN